MNKIFTLISSKYQVEYTIVLDSMLMVYINENNDRFGLKIVYNTYSNEPLEDYIILGSTRDYTHLYQECRNLQMIIHDFLASDEKSIVVKDPDFLVM